MKLTIVTVLLAIAFATEASVIGHPEWSAWGNTWHSAWDDGHHGHLGHSTHGISLNQDHGWDHHNDYHNEPSHHAHHDHHHNHASHYVAKTLGAVHSAPLPGHIESVKSLNVAPAPGSEWDHHNHHHHAHHDHHHASHYIAKTLGAVHTAPLPGHIESVKSLNVAPAPGYGWDHHHHHHAPAHHAHHDHHHASHYVAKTLGAVHSAPLPGHIDSVKSFNLASAPGTH